ncbi:hypothetical protein ACQ143_04725 [Microbacterium sp. MC2]
MAIIESRPFLTPVASSVEARISLVPEGLDLERIAEDWVPGDDLTFRCVASLQDSFWAETLIDKDEEVSLVLIVACTPARARWRAQVPFEAVDGVWRAELELVVDGGEIAVELTADVWVVGPGRTGSSSAAHAVHQAAKLWQRDSLMWIPLERASAGFPTSAVSFSGTGRRAVPWSVEIAADSEPGWSISGSVRLYVNTDLEICHSIVEGTASEDVYSAITCDIHLAVLHQIGSWRDSINGAALQATADDDHGCLAAMGANIALTLGLTLDEACRLAIEDPLGLATRSRESVEYYGKVGAA